MKTKKSLLGIAARGLAMGAADVVPGVSGGTIAFITGIYDELLKSISAFDLSLIGLLKKEGVRTVWTKVNGSFLTSLFLGIGISIISLAKLLGGLLQSHPHQLWSFFLGLILASIIYMVKQIPKLNLQSIIGIMIGTAIVLGLSILPPLGNSTNLFYLFFSGMIAISAMILPGISGAFLLLILGVYQTIIGAISNIKEDFMVLTVFGLGCIFGLLSFSRLLKWVFNKYNSMTLSVLTGFLVGSIYKLWPWRHVESIFVKHLGEPKEEVVNLVDSPVLPGNYDEIIRVNERITGYTNIEPDIMLCIILSIIGFSIIFSMERFGNKTNK